MGAIVSLATKAGVVKPVSKPAPTPQPVSPTTAEVSQSAATNQDGGTDMRKVRRKGRSATILTSTSGVEGDTTLGTKSLLGG